jgi:hypothetical protein
MNAGYPQDQPAIQPLKVYMTERRRIVAQVRRGPPGTPGNSGGPGCPGNAATGLGNPPPEGHGKKIAGCDDFLTTGVDRSDQAGL